MTFYGDFCPNCGAMLHTFLCEEVRVNCPKAENALSWISHVLLDAVKQPEETAKYEAPIRSPLPRPHIA